IILTKEIRQTLAEWIVLKALTAEHNFLPGANKDVIFDQVARTEFMNTRKIPDRIHIHIGMQKSKKWETRFQRHTTGLGFSTQLPPPPPPKDRTVNVQIMTWGIGNLLIHMSAILDQDVYDRLKLLQPGPLIEIWPNGNTDTTWPPRYFATDEFVDELAGSLWQFVNSKNVIKV
ncbi:MAG TPA: hypothetical protein VFR09_07290, partial [Alphaproteobacteria bacterium]|nr:hypothetical protein [Alphaproteobacteria bacterium]